MSTVKYTYGIYRMTFTGSDLDMMNLAPMLYKTNSHPIKGQKRGTFLFSSLRRDDNIITAELWHRPEGWTAALLIPRRFKVWRWLCRLMGLGSSRTRRMQVYYETDLRAVETTGTLMAETWDGATTIHEVG